MSDLVIRPIAEDDAAAIHQMRVRERVAELITSYPSERPGSSRAYMDRFGEDDHVFVAELDGRVIGMAGLHARKGKMRHSAWLGIMVHDEFHGRGVGRALMTRLLELADRWLGLVRVDLTVLAYNERAVALSEKLGFVREGVQRKACYFDGQLHDIVMMARLRD